MKKRVPGDSKENVSWGRPRQAVDCRFEKTFNKVEHYSAVRYDCKRERVASANARRQQEKERETGRGATSD